MSINGRGDSGHRTAGRVLDILEQVGDAPRGCSLRDLSAAIGAPKSSLLPLLRTLTARDYLLHDAAVYRCGPRMLATGLSTPGEPDLRDAARPALSALSTQTGEAVLLATLASDGLAIVYIDKFESVHRIRFVAGVGERRPLHSTSSGKVLLAFMAPARQRAVIDTIDFVRYTEETVTTPDALRAELEKVRAEGVCVNIDQATVGRCAIAAPIIDRRGEAIAAVVLGAPKDRVMSVLPDTLNRVKAAATTVSRALGAAAMEHPPAGQ